MILDFNISIDSLHKAESNVNFSAKLTALHEVLCKKSSDNSNEKNAIYHSFQENTAFDYAV